VLRNERVLRLGSKPLRARICEETEGGEPVVAEYSIPQILSTSARSDSPTEVTLAETSTELVREDEWGKRSNERTESFFLKAHPDLGTGFSEQPHSCPGMNLQNVPDFGLVREDDGGK
jgi:hypothetical protein